MVSRADRSAFAEWWWTVDKYLLAALVALIVGGVVLSLAGSPSVAERLGYDSFHFFKRHVFFFLPATAVMIATSFLTPRQTRRGGRSRGPSALRAPIATRTRTPVSSCRAAAWTARAAIAARRTSRCSRSTTISTLDSRWTEDTRGSRAPPAIGRSYPTAKRSCAIDLWARDASTVMASSVSRCASASRNRETGADDEEARSPRDAPPEDK